MTAHCMVPTLESQHSDGQEIMNHHVYKEKVPIHNPLLRLDTFTRC